MSIYEAVGIAWIIFTSALATVGVLYLAYIGLRVKLDEAQEDKEGAVPVEVKEMFKIAR
jgi:threonine/homoserine/homoserine lactone efflux protein